jgi:methylated-DNA-protein-cysteine methyltransferase-like protein
MDAHPGFDERVWAAVARIPRGSLATYGQIAELIGAYGCARQVGWALRRLPLPSPIPWHRVVNARGCISMSLAREGSDWIQRELLLAEGIPVDQDGRLPLAHFRWVPPPRILTSGSPPGLSADPHGDPSGDGAHDDGPDEHAREC